MEFSEFETYMQSLRDGCANGMAENAGQPGYAKRMWQLSGTLMSLQSEYYNNDKDERPR